jgi:lipopolysaccharide/colanic/teichoic acid biosynthesis glycosyltransferase
MRRAVRAADFARSVSLRLADTPSAKHPLTSSATAPSTFPVRLHVISEDLFNGVILRERRRAERTEKPFVLYLVDADTEARHRPVLLWRSTLDSLAAARRDTDILGWFKQDTVAGVILSGTDAVRMAYEFDARFRRELAKRLHQTTIDRLSVRFHAYPEPKTETRRNAALDKAVFLKLAVPPRPGTHYDSVKRAIDVTVGSVLLLLLSPLMLTVAAFVKCRSKGPVLYKQERIGRMNKPFKMLKFRTMHVAADPAIHQEFVTRFIKAGGPMADPGQSGLFKITNDPRIIPGGHFLRKTSMDELPQLLNVIRGEMSLVGPRPPLAYEIEHYRLWHGRRVLEVKPGVTGLWQVKGRSRTSFDEMVRLDLQYARTYSFWTDLKILLATPAAVFTGKGAV